MTTSVRRGGCQALIVVVLAGVVVGSVLIGVPRGPAAAAQVAAQVGILVPATAAVLGLIKWMPSLPTRSIGNAVGELRHGGVAVGRVVRVGWRHLICPSGTVCTVLQVSDGDAQESVPGRHLTVYFPAGASGTSGRGGGGVEAKVAAWGPGLLRLGRPKLAVLRTARPLPPSIRRLSLARHPHRGRAHVLLADPGGAPSAAAGPAGRVDGTKLTITQVLPPGAAGAPVLAGAPDANTGAVVAFVAAEAGGPVPVPPPGTERSVPLVAADEAQLLLDSVNRRQALKLGAVGAVVAVGGGTFLAIRWREHPMVIKGAGWRDLFEDKLVTAGLATQLHAARGLDASAYTYDVKQMSGVESLNKLTPQLLRDYDFVTCPNDAVREKLEKKIGDAGKTLERSEFCHGRMVLLVRRNAVRALQRADLLSFEQRKAGEPEVRFDVQTYLDRYGKLPAWGKADPDFVGDNSGKQIKIGFSNPSKAGGGELFLAMLREAQTDLGFKDQRGTAEWLWGEDGPLHFDGEATTKLLLRTFLNGGPQQMVFVYEHDVIAALLKEPERAKNYVLLRTSLEAVFTQFVLSLRPAGGVVGKALMGPLAQTLFEQFRVRATGKGYGVDQLLAGPVLAEVRKPGVHVTRRASRGARTVEFQATVLDDLVRQMSTSAPTSP